MSDKSYSAACGLKPFDWPMFIDRAELGEVSDEQWREAAKLSKDWPTCGCGVQCAVIPRRGCGLPIDNELLGHGLHFNEAIIRRDVPKARKVLAAIEARSSILITEELAKLGKVTV